ncbi:hypothetical protein [Tahibacter amnicola]|uniref:Secreted protein n=1 Tax=Tahibacter amnicola TaxID=2976241 RepID=A0ABY6BQS4_9GAMM|nr:hypothetical protein [Tahibacter amnicola]UXI70765.1 hypothetical protein N4264_15130 [Tahibacter amnicola]
MAGVIFVAVSSATRASIATVPSGLVRHCTALGTRSFNSVWTRSAPSRRDTPTQPARIVNAAASGSRNIVRSIISTRWQARVATPGGLAHMRKE